jgi:UDP-N-acetylglucosamine:LPS N-acetylglucosamine transferase
MGAILDHPEAAQKMAKAARGTAMPDAAVTLADMVETLASKETQAP